MSHLIAELVDLLKRLPGLGPRSAQRLVYHLLREDRTAAQRIAETLAAAVVRVRHCSECNAFTESDLCVRCTDPARDASQLCVVETPADLEAIEASHVFHGRYYVLMGRLSPLDGVGPRELQVDRFLERATRTEVQEVILATNFTPDGEATAQWLAQRLRALAPNLRITRLARGVPVGGELEYADPATIAYAWHDRRFSDVL
ncbi:MAG: recombination mediator RecR [Hydrogenophilus sp.]|nr:recombination mediator RecR [Hydrogenophilus sp.]